jgi:hypothetical protein
MIFVERLYDLLKDKEISWEAAKALGDVVDSDVILTKDNHADIKVMLVRNYFDYRLRSTQDPLQKYVSVILPKLVALARTGGGENGVIQSVLLIDHDYRCY